MKICMRAKEGGLSSLVYKAFRTQYEVPEEEEASIILFHDLSWLKLT